MKTWNEVTKMYPAYLKFQVKVPGLRMAALSKIEKSIKDYAPNLLKGNYMFMHIAKEDLKEKYEGWKGTVLNGAEKQAINDLYKLSKLP